MTAPVVPAIRALQCPSCGGSVELRGTAHSLNAVCVQCLSILDASSPTVRVLQEAQSRQRFTPLVPLGKRGKLEGTIYEAIGFQMREILVDGVPYRWSEYLLFNPYKGYRYLTEYEGHWNLVRSLNLLPKKVLGGSKKAVMVEGTVYKHFQTATATTTYILGEFPWQVRYGDSAVAEDYVAPPRVVSSEETKEEEVWSIGTYMPGADVWQAFDLPGVPPTPTGIYANQPSPYAQRVGSSWITFAILLAITMLGLITVNALAPRDRLFQQGYTFFPADVGEHSFVTDFFEVKGRPAPIEIAIRTNVLNDWIFFNFALINEDTGTAYNVSKEIEYYTGSEEEGSPRGVARLPVVPSGRYYLRVEPEMEPGRRLAQNVQYSLDVQRAAPGVGWFTVAILLLLVPPSFISIRALRFENSRWAESDYGPLVKLPSKGDEDDEDD